MRAWSASTAPTPSQSRFRSGRWGLELIRMNWSSLEFMRMDERFRPRGQACLRRFGMRFRHVVSPWGPMGAGVGAGPVGMPKQRGLVPSMPSTPKVGAIEGRAFVVENCSHTHNHTHIQGRALVVENYSPILHTGGLPFARWRRLDGDEVRASSRQGGAGKKRRGRRSAPRRSRRALPWSRSSLPRPRVNTPSPSCSLPFPY